MQKVLPVNEVDLKLNLVALLNMISIGSGINRNNMLKVNIKYLTMQFLHYQTLLIQNYKENNLEEDLQKILGKELDEKLNQEYADFNLQISLPEFIIKYPTQFDQFEYEKNNKFLHQKFNFNADLCYLAGLHLRNFRAKMFDL